MVKKGHRRAQTVAAVGGPGREIFMETENHILEYSNAFKYGVAVMVIGPPVTERWDNAGEQGHRADNGVRRQFPEVRLFKHTKL